MGVKKHLLSIWVKVSSTKSGQGRLLFPFNDVVTERDGATEQREPLQQRGAHWQNEQRLPACNSREEKEISEQMKKYATTLYSVKYIFSENEGHFQLLNQPQFCYSNAVYF